MKQFIQSFFLILFAISMTLGVHASERSFHAWLPDKIEHPSLGEPTDAAVAQDGSVYVLTGYGIKKLDKNGHLLLEWGSEGSGDGEFNNAKGITIDNNGNLYVADTYNHRIQKFSSDGTFVTKWGSVGRAEGR